jgi:hypothetical protein
LSRVVNAGVFEAFALCGSFLFQLALNQRAREVIYRKWDFAFEEQTGKGLDVVVSDGQFARPLFLAWHEVWLPPGTSWGTTVNRRSVGKELKLAALYSA